MQEGRYVAKLIRRRLTGRPDPGPFRYRDLGTMTTISPGDAVADAFGVRLAEVRGKAAWALVHVSFLVGWGNRLSVLARWGYALGTRNRSERVIVHGIGPAGAAGGTAGGEARMPERVRR